MNKTTSIDVVLNDIDDNVRYWIDVTKIHKMTKTSQETAPIGTSPAIHACNTRMSQPKQEKPTLKPRFRTPR